MESKELQRCKGQSSQRERVYTESDRSCQSLLLYQGGKGVPARLRSGKRTVKWERKRADATENESLTPDHALLVQKIIDDFNAVAHLGLCALRHGNDGSTDFPWLDIVERGDAFRPAFLQLLFITCHACPSFLMNPAIPEPAIAGPMNYLRTVSLAHG